MSAVSAETSARPGARFSFADALTLAACFVVLAFGLGRYGLYEPHEGHFAGIAREMALTGDYVTPHLNGSPYLNKPPLVYWSIALSYRVLGIGEGAARLPLAFFGWLGLVMAWHWARRLWGAQAGPLAAAMLAVCTGWFMFTHQLLIDVLLSTLILAALYALWRAMCQPESRKHWVCFWALLALTWLAKGPMGSLFVGLAWLGWCAARGRWDSFKRCGWTWGVPLMLAPVVLWGWFVEQSNPGFVYHVFVNELLDRLQDKRWPPDYKVSQVSVAGYLAVTAIWCAPWTLLAPWVARFAWNGAKQAEDHEQEEGDDRADRERRDAVLLLAFGALGPVFFFLPVPSRLVYYCLPTAPAFVLLTAGWWMRFVDARAERLERQIPGALLALTGAAIFSAGFWVTPLVARIPDMARAPEALALIPSMAWLLGAAFLAGGAALWGGHPRAAVLVLFLGMGLGFVCAADGFAAYQDVRSSKRLVAELDAKLGAGTLWVFEGSYELGAAGGLSFYLGADAQGRPRTVRVMLDDPRRPQPVFANLPRHYGMLRDELLARWTSEEAVVFVTDPMRRDWDAPEQRPLAYVMDPEAERRRELILKRAEWGVEILGAPLAEEYGFRRVYANAAARRKLGLP
ncbi:MAG: hypothetical protein AMXMBFR7_48220 [Planctomycetota bacterium]